MMVRHYEIDFNSGALVFPGAASTRATGDHRDTRTLFRAARARRGDLEFPHRRDPRNLRESGILLARPKGSKTLVDAKRASEIEAAHRADLCDSKISFLKV